MLPDKHSYDVGEERSVGVAPVLEVDHDEQLREQDHVHQVRTHGPKENITRVREGAVL